MRISSGLLLIAALSLLPLAGCGGGGSGNSGGSNPVPVEPGPVPGLEPGPNPTPEPNPTPQPNPVPTPTPPLEPPRLTNVLFDVSWAERGRATRSSGRSSSVPASALSIVVTLGGGAGEDGQDARFLLNRRDAPGSYIERFTSQSRIKVGQYPLSVRCFSEKDAAGALVGIGDAIVTVRDDGSGIGTIATTGLVRRVEVAAGQSIKAGESKDLSFAARSESGDLIAVTPGSARWSVVAGGEHLRIESSGPGAQGLLPGVARVTATLDEITSAPGEVRVTSDAVVTVVPDSAALPAYSTREFTATVANASNSSVVWRVQEGEVGGTITPNGVYTAPSAPGTYHLVATSRYDPEKSASVAVTVYRRITITPEQWTLTLRKKRLFTTSLEGVQNPAVTWSIEEGDAGGAISPEGEYTAPGSPGVFHIVAASQEVPGLKARAQVTVEAGSGVVIIQ